MSKPA
jgi:hypothetical protein